MTSTANSVGIREADEPLPCPFCGGPAKTFAYNGTTQATCASDFVSCAGADGYSPVAMWNRRVVSAPLGEPEDKGPSALRSDTHRAPEGAVVGWQPIETAPRDGTDILVANTNGAMFVVRWDADGRNGPGWIDGATDNDGDLITYDAPAFWMPLPAAPDAASPAEQVGMSEANAPKNTPAPTEKGDGLWPVGSWLSAALDDPKVCDEMKRDIREWFDGNGHIRDAMIAATQQAVSPAEGVERDAD